MNEQIEELAILHVDKLKLIESHEIVEKAERNVGIFIIEIEQLFCDCSVPGLGGPQVEQTFGRFEKVVEYFEHHEASLIMKR